MADQATVDAQQQNKMAQLQAMAAGTAYQAPADSTAAASTQALGGLAERAAKIGAPQAAMAEWTSAGAQPWENALSNMAAGAGMQNASKSALDQISANYAAEAAKAPVYGRFAPGASGSGSGGLGGAANAYRGGYPTDTSYENAVTAMAQQAAQQAQADALAASQQARSDFGSGIPAPDAQQAQDDLLAQLFQMNQIEDAGNKYVAARDMERQAPTPTHGSYAEAARQGAGSSAEWARYLDSINGGDAGVVNRSAALLSPDWNPGMNRLAMSLADEQSRSADPLNLYEYARNVAVNGLGADPGDAFGRFSPEWAMGLATKDLSGPNAYATQQQEYAERTANAQAGYGPVTNRELQAQQGSPADQVRQSPEYQDAAAAALGMLQQGFSQQGDTKVPVTIDDLKALLVQDNVPADVAAQILTDLGPRFPASSYYDRPPAG